MHHSAEKPVVFTKFELYTARLVKKSHKNGFKLQSEYMRA